MIALNNIKKQYGAVTALSAASLQLLPGEFHALLGSNGSGKSTLIKILAGAETPDSGEYRADTRLTHLSSTAHAQALGISVAYQDLSLIPSLSVEQNAALAINGRFARDGVREARARIRPLLDAIDFEIDLARPVMDLTIPERYQLEIVKALAQRPRFFVMDEATAALDAEQVERVFRLLAQLRSSGLCVLFVSHRLDEVLQFCTKATILREGSTVTQTNVDAHSRETLLELISGCEERSPRAVRAAEREFGHVMLEIRDVSAPPKLKSVSLSVRSGEIVGLGGLQGQGQREFLRVLGLLEPRERGDVFVTTSRIPLTRLRDARRLTWFLSGDRGSEGVFPGRPVYENTLAQHFAIGGVLRALSPAKLRQAASEVLVRISVRGRPEQPIETLSGGNQQKALLARLLRAHPEVILLDDPTIGVDPASRSEIHDILRDLAAKGTAIIFFSSDDEELLTLADRVLVFYEGKVVKHLSGEQMHRAGVIEAALHSTDQSERVSDAT